MPPRDGGDELTAGLAVLMPVVNLTFFGFIGATVKLVGCCPAVALMQSPSLGNTKAEVRSVTRAHASVFYPRNQPTAVDICLRIYLDFSLHAISLRREPRPSLKEHSGLA